MTAETGKGVVCPRAKHLSIQALLSQLHSMKQTHCIVEIQEKQQLLNVKNIFIVECQSEAIPPTLKDA